MTPKEFLTRAAAAAHAGGHIYPHHAACEAALESAWGTSALAMQANNLFGQKQSHPVRGASLALETREFLRGAWVTVAAEWVRFASWEEAFRERMHTLERLASAYPHYRAALAATTGEAFILEVSKSWSTDPGRAAKVLELWREHFGSATAQVA